MNPNSTGRPDIEALLKPFKTAVDQLWTAVALDSRSEARSSTVLITGVNEHAGASTVAVCTATGLAHHLLVPTVLVETHDGDGSIANLFGLPQSPGLGEVLEGNLDLSDAAVETGIPNLKVVPYGHHRHGGLSAAALHELFDELTQQFRYVVLDAPPILDDAHTRVMLRYVNRALLVLEAQKSSQDRAQRAIEMIEQQPSVELIGTVLNKYKAEAPSWLIPSKFSA